MTQIIWSNPPKTNLPCCTIRGYKSGRTFFIRNEAEIIHKAYRLDDDPIHDQDVYLSPEKLAKLKREEGVEPFTFVQFEHDSVFIPAGAAHQVSTFQCDYMSLSFNSSPQFASISQKLNFGHIFSAGLACQLAYCAPNFVLGQTKVCYDSPRSGAFRKFLRI